MLCVLDITFTFVEILLGTILYMHGGNTLSPPSLFLRPSTGKKWIFFRGSSRKGNRISFLGACLPEFISLNLTSLFLLWTTVRTTKNKLIFLDNFNGVNGLHHSVWEVWNPGVHVCFARLKPHLILPLNSNLRQTFHIHFLKMIYIYKFLMECKFSGAFIFRMWVFQCLLQLLSTISMRLSTKLWRIHQVCAKIILWNFLTHFSSRAWESLS